MIMRIVLPSATSSQL